MPITTARNAGCAVLSCGDDAASARTAKTAATLSSASAHVRREAAVGRCVTAVTTLRQQKRDVLDYLTHAYAAAMYGDQAPSLLPDASIKSGT